MHRTVKYAALSGLILLAALGVSGLGFTIAADNFDNAAKTQHGEPEFRNADRRSSDIGIVQSPLIGAKAAAPQMATADAAAQMVKVIDAVNMRRGPSSSHQVLKVQLEGAELRVESRKGSWIQVVEPSTGAEGWIYQAYVTPIAVSSRRAEAGETAIR